MSILSSGIATADGILASLSLQSDITIERFTGMSGKDKQYSSPETIGAAVDYRRSQVRTANGTISASRCTVTITNVARLLEITGGGTLSDNDRITLPDGTTGPTVAISGFMDPETSKPAAVDVYIG